MNSKFLVKLFYFYFSTAAPVEENFAYRSGIYLLVHNQSRPLMSLTGGIYLAAGLETGIAVSRTFITKQPAPFSNCLSDMIPFSSYSEKIFNYFQKFNVTKYDQEVCINFCYQDKLIENCHCASLITETLNDTKYCANKSERECEKNLTTSFATSNTDDFCDNVCRPECTTQKFDYSISLSKFPTQDYTNLHPDQKPPLRFIVDYKDNIYTEVIESPKVTFEKLLGDIGGQMSLFIGISFLSFLEVLELLIEIAVLFYQHKTKKSQSNSIALS
jgi:hypothetical protein